MTQQMPCLIGELGGDSSWLACHSLQNGPSLTAACAHPEQVCTGWEGVFRAQPSLLTCCLHLLLHLLYLQRGKEAACAREFKLPLSLYFYIWILVKPSYFVVCVYVCGIYMCVCEGALNCAHECRGWRSTSGVLCHSPPFLMIHPQVIS